LSFDRWLTADRATAWVRTLAVVTAVVVVAWVALSRHGVDPMGNLLGTDFISFWTAARLVVQGAPASAVYDDHLLQAAQRAAFPGVDVGFSPFPYPPVFVLICLPLGLAPYLPALAAWTAVTGVAYWRVVRAWSAGAFASTLAALAFPAALLNLGNGQNGFLTTALFGAGTLALRRRPLLGGACLGLLIFKPHLGLLIPLALAAARQWRAFVGAALAAAGLTAAATLALGIASWAAFLKMAPQMRNAVEAGLLHPGKVQSVFAALRLWGVSIGWAYGGQALVSFGAAVAVAIFAYRRPRSPAFGPVLIVATLLVTPYVLDYDLVLLAIPLSFMLREALRRGFLPWEKAVLLGGYVAPLATRIVAMHLHVPLAPPMLLALLAITLRRGWIEEADEHVDTLGAAATVKAGPP
jgi:alpha-1,2-mannosyltransferase